MKPSFLLGTLFLLLRGWGSCAQDLELWRINSHGIYGRGIISKRDIKALKHSISSQVGSDSVTVANVLVYPTERDRWSAEGQTGTTDCAYKSWRHALHYARYTTPTGHCANVAQVLKLGRDIVFREIDAACTAREDVLQGSNPLELGATYREFRIVDVALPMWSLNDLGAPALIVYVRSARKPTVADARGLLAYVKTKTGAQRVDVVVRPDAWFADQCDCPFSFIFADSKDARKLPSEVEYRAADQAVCVSDPPSGDRCWREPLEREGSRRGAAGRSASLVLSRTHRGP